MEVTLLSNAGQWNDKLRLLGQSPFWWMALPYSSNLRELITIIKASQKKIMKDQQNV